MDSPCKSDGECVDILTNNFIAAHNGVTKGNAPIFIDAINCYPDRQNTCACSSEMGWVGEYCDQISQTSINSSILLAAATLIGLSIACYRAPIMYALVKSHLLKLNPSGVTTILAWIALMLQILSGSLFILSFYTPGVPIRDLAFDVQYVAFGISVLAVLGVNICFYEVSKKALRKVRVPRLPIGIATTLFLLSYIVLFELQIHVAVAALVIAECIILFAALATTVQMMTMKFSASLIHAEWRYEVLAERSYGCLSELVTSASITSLLLQHETCKRDVAAGRLNEEESEMSKRGGVSPTALYDKLKNGRISAGKEKNIQAAVGGQSSAPSSQGTDNSAKITTAEPEDEKDPEDGYRYYWNMSNLGAQTNTKKLATAEDLDKERQRQIKQKYIAELRSIGMDNGFFSPYYGATENHFSSLSPFSELSSHGGALSFLESSIHGIRGGISSLVIGLEGSIHGGRGPKSEVARNPDNVMSGKFKAMGHHGNVDKKFNRHTVDFLGRVLVLCLRLFTSLSIYIASQVLVFLYLNTYEEKGKYPISLTSIWKSFQLIAISMISNDILWFVNESSKRNIAKYREEQMKKTSKNSKNHNEGKGSSDRAQRPEKLSNLRESKESDSKHGSGEATPRGSFTFGASQTSSLGVNGTKRQQRAVELETAGVEQMNAIANKYSGDD